MNFGSGKNFSNNPSDKINIAPKVNFGQLKGQPSTSSILFPLQSEKKRLFNAAGKINSSGGLNQQELSNLTLLSKDIRSYDKGFLLQTQGKSIEESFKKFKNQICLSSSLEPNDLQYFCEMTLESYLELLNSKDGDTIKKFINQCQYELLQNLEYKTVNSTEISNIEDFASRNLNQRNNNQNNYNYNINNN